MANIEYKSYNGSVEDVDSKGRVKIAVASFGNIDSHKDIIQKGAFSKTLNDFFPRTKWYLNHKRDQLLGVPIEGIETDTNLIITAQLNLKKQIGRDTYADYKLHAEHGRTLEHSIGALPIQFTKDQKSGIRTVREYKLFEFSTLTEWGSNWNTPLVSLKSASGIEETINFMEYQLKNGNYSDEKFKIIEKSLQNIRSLVAEPSLQQEPSADTLKSASKQKFLNALKIS